MKRRKSLILNVDDAEAGRYAKSRTLKLAGYDVIEAANGTDALRLFAESNPDAILLDVQLPDINGLEVCRRVKEQSEVPVLQISASHIGTDDKVKGLKNGADAYLAEPVDPDILIATLNALIRARRAEEALREINRRKDSFLTALSHEIRNTLAPLRNAMDLITNPAAAPAQVERSKEVMNRQIGYLSRLIEDLLDIARLNENKMSIVRESVSVNDLLRDIADDYEDVWVDSKINFKLSLPSEVIYADADKARLHQVIVNLLHNANKFTDENGTITMSLVRNENGSFQITVADTGIGIDKETMNFVFERFTQGEGAYTRTKSGLGLGLSIVQGLVALHSGTVKVESDGLGKGSKFTVTLPSLEKPEAKAVQVVELKPARALRVLIVDDNVDAGDTLGMLCEMKGHTVRVARGGESAIQIATEFIPELIVCDIGLPGMNGYAVLDKLKKDENLKSTVFVALTGFGSDEDKKKSAAAGFHYHLTKPVGIEELEKIMMSIG